MAGAAATSSGQPAARSQRATGTLALHQHARPPTMPASPPGVTSLVTVFPPSLVRSLAIPHISCVAVTYTIASVLLQLSCARWTGGGGGHEGARQAVRGADAPGGRPAQQPRRSARPPRRLMTASSRCGLPGRPVARHRRSPSRRRTCQPNSMPMPTSCNDSPVSSVVLMPHLAPISPATRLVATPASS